uniref:Uncharacterized protein n=1 Tax=Octopus bimaculoides TaxID=37653 RepID=A0A0L8HRC3_OCTBM
MSPLKFPGLFWAVLLLDLASHTPENVFLQAERVCLQEVEPILDVVSQLDFEILIFASAIC